MAADPGGAAAAVSRHDGAPGSAGPGAPAAERDRDRDGGAGGVPGGGASRDRPRLVIPANLYVPKGLKGPAPGVLYVCGHARNQKVHYQAHPRRWAELGFVCLLVETIKTVELAEATGTHHGPYREGWFHWYSRGFTSAGIELLNGIRALDLLAARPEVNPTQLRGHRDLRRRRGIVVDRGRRRAGEGGSTRLRNRDA